MYSRDLIGKTQEEAARIITSEGETYTIERDIRAANWDTELVIRVRYSNGYRLVTSGFKLKPDLRDTDNE